jgi:hypothetical protein
MESRIKNELLQNGYAHIKFPASTCKEDIISSLGQMIQETQIRENPKSTRILASNQAMGFHTDHNAANYIVWFCHSQSAFGGESLLLDINTVLEGFSEKGLALLQEVDVKTHNVFYGDKHTHPLISFTKQRVQVYYSEWLVNQPLSVLHKNELAKFEERIQSTTPIKLLLSEGDMLIVDNKRMLHGRTAFPEKANRWLTRYWIK